MPFREAVTDYSETFTGKKVCRCRGSIFGIGQQEHFVVLTNSTCYFPTCLHKLGLFYCQVEDELAISGYPPVKEGELFTPRARIELLILVYITLRASIHA